ncbi:iron complex transport system substrate-binding protein [Marinobacter daqiaonensis]|uniref:Iron complex transport system substrate-binding protein n=1 Tax=Marinobacter daqiaonensis TaxID=650891 RepID=A0A1I6I047_9GAMM|nr:iron-siderophore ABC transporter substrate-binding protein [Marinobacter daqiaonensis]SFR60096.1 iron complex transport system substrate-binding protein [Marinobacter daqiaonensis]
MLKARHPGPALRALLLLVVCTTASAGTVITHEAGEVRFEEPPQRVVALNWWLAEHLLALGVVPVGVTEREGYRQWVAEPPLPDSVRSVGRRQSPNLEAIRALKPDLILVSGHLMAAVPALKTIAPTVVQTTYEADSNPWIRARAHLITLGRILEREDRARQVIQQAEDELRLTRQQLAEAGLAGQTAFLVRFLDDKRLRIHGENSMLHQALVQAGLANAWQQPTNLWGFTPGTVADLGGHPDAWLIYVRPWPESDRERLQASPLWPYLPMARHGRIVGVGPVWTFGGVLSVPRMAQMLADQLLAGPEDRR